MAHQLRGCTTLLDILSLIHNTPTREPLIPAPCDWMPLPFMNIYTCMHACTHTQKKNLKIIVYICVFLKIVS